MSSPAPVCGAPSCREPASVLCRTCVAYMCAQHNEDVHARRAAAGGGEHERAPPDPAADEAFFREIQAEEEGGDEGMPGGFFAKMSMISQALVDMVVRPPRAVYTTGDLGPVSIMMSCGVRLVRRDFEVTNPRGLKLQCSIWEPQVDGGAQLPVVLYTHGNSSCRAAVVESPVLYTVAAAGMRLVALDFAGSGLSEGDYVTLGAHEQHDVAAVLEHVRERETASRVALWGTSMGAVSAILHTSAKGGVDALVLDSPFASFAQLARDLASDGSVGVAVRGGLQRVALWALRWAVKRAAQFDLRTLEIEPHAARCTAPALFASGQYDELVRPGQVASLHAAWAGEQKDHFEFHGDHNSPRPPEFYRRARALLVEALQPPQEFEPMPARRRSSGSVSMPGPPLPGEPLGPGSPDRPPPAPEPEPASPPPHPLPPSPPSPALEGLAGGALEDLGDMGGAMGT